MALEVSSLFEGFVAILTKMFSRPRMLLPDVSIKSTFCAERLGFLGPADITVLP